MSWHCSKNALAGKRTVRWKTTKFEEYIHVLSRRNKNIHQISIIFVSREQYIYTYIVTSCNPVFAYFFTTLRHNLGFQETNYVLFQCYCLETRGSDYPWKKEGSLCRERNVAETVVARGLRTSLCPVLWDRCVQCKDDGRVNDGLPVTTTRHTGHTRRNGLEQR